MDSKMTVEPVEERDPGTDQDWKDRVANFIGESETKALRGDHASSSKPDIAKPGAEIFVHELREIARVNGDVPPGYRQLATTEDEGGFLAVRPPEPFGFERQRGLVGSRSHHIAVDGLEEGLDESGLHRGSACEFVRGLEPVDASVLARDETVETRCHMDRHARIGACHSFSVK